MDELRPFCCGVSWVVGILPEAGFLIAHLGIVHWYGCSSNPYLFPHSLRMPDVFSMSQTATELASQSPVCSRMSQVLSSCTRMCATTLHTWNLQRSASQPQAGCLLWVEDGNILDNNISLSVWIYLFSVSRHMCHDISSLYIWISTYAD